MDDMRSLVEAVVCDIPWGRVMTYGDLAAASGYPGAARRVGTIASQGTPEHPWHRVVASAGRITTEGTWQSDSLTAEGIIVQDNRIQCFATLRWFPEIEG